VELGASCYKGGVRRLNWDELADRAERMDALALAGASLDRFCSSSAWSLSAADSFEPRGDCWSFEGAGGLLAFARRHRGEIRVIEPLEASWALGCPLLGQPRPLAAALAEQLAQDARDWEVCVVTGIDEGSAALAETWAVLGAWFEVGRVSSTRRHVASLAGGVDGYLARRSRSVRKTLRQAHRRCTAGGIRFSLERPTGSDEVGRAFDRLLAIEGQSWKGLAEIGLGEPEMQVFYRSMAARLAARGELWLQFATLADQDVGYLMGAVFGDTFRGLQFSFAESTRPLGLGNVAQLELVRRLADRPEIRRYDLGTGGDYKPRWAESHFDTAVLAVTHLG